MLEGNPMKINVALVKRAEELGWELVWRELSRAEIEASASEGEAGSDDCDPIYGVHAYIQAAPNEPLLLWYRFWPSSTLDIVRSETRAERYDEDYAAGRGSYTGEPQH